MLTIHNCTDWKALYAYQQQLAYGADLDEGVKADGNR